MAYEFDMVEIDGHLCADGHPMTYTPAITSGRSTTSSCDIDGETGTSIDDYNLCCARDSLFVSESYGACPIDQTHELTRRLD
jgi:hypothetical protein